VAGQVINVATIYVDDGSVDKVRKAFKAAKISVVAAGIRTYGFLVRLKCHDRALSVLKQESDPTGDL
jgi:hypothetical protein